MSRLLSLMRAARLVGVARSELQKKIRDGEMVAYDGMVEADALLACYPAAQIEDDAEFRRIAQIKEKAFGKRVFERTLPDAEVLAARVTELGKTLAAAQRQLASFDELMGKLHGRLDGLRNGAGAETRAVLEAFEVWIKEEAEAAMEPGYNNPLAVRDNILRVMAAQVTLQPSGQDFLVEGQDTLLEAAMRAGIALNYGCSGGNCGLCKARLVSGQVKKTRHHDFVIPEQQKAQGYILLCSNTPVSDVVLEAEVAAGVQDIPLQQINATVKASGALGADMLLLHLQTPRTRRLRFLAGQKVNLRVGQVYSTELPIASCPCDDRNLLFHVRRQSGNLFSDYVFERLKNGETVEIEGPQGEFILHERSPRALHFFAFDGGFAPIKSLIEHAISLEVPAIRLYWIGSDAGHIYLPNVGRAWADALDDFRYQEACAGFDLLSLGGRREPALRDLLARITAADDGILQGDVYAAGPAAAVHLTERYFLERGLPKTRVFAESLR